MYLEGHFLSTLLTTSQIDNRKSTVEYDNQKFCTMNMIFYVYACVPNF